MMLVIIICFDVACHRKWRQALAGARFLGFRPLEAGKRKFHMGRLKGKVALITGGATGIGRAAAQLFVEEGAKVYITGRRAAELEAAAKEIGGPIVAIAGDVSKSEDLDRIYAQIGKDEGKLDIVYANAGG